MKKFGLALGGGGVRGLAHILALETLDDCGIKPVAVAGTSMGAIIGALYAGGNSGKDIRGIVEKYIIMSTDKLKDIYAKKKHLIKWLKAVRLEMGRGGILCVDGFLQYLLDEIKVSEFEDLQIPFHVVTTNFWTGEQVVFSSGKLIDAIRASMAIPGVFAPVVIDGEVLVDGGVVNNVPYDIIAELCDVTVAVDVAVTRRREQVKVPNMLDSVLGMFDILVDEATERKMREMPPMIYSKPEIVNIRPLDFDKIEDVLSQARPAMDELKEQLNRAKD
jgi:NTE family protein